MLSGKEPKVLMKNIVKIYPDGTVALRGVNLELMPGEVHALLGENGAGKTTLMRILYGEIKPTRGEIYVKGSKVSFRGPWDAIRQGIAMVYQHFTLVPTFTVLENLVLALHTVKGIRRSDVEAKVKELMRDIGLEVPLDAYVEDLPVGLQQRVEILKALLRECEVLILDEPTSVLTPIEVKELFRTIKRLKERGITVVFITHKLREVMAVADRVTVLRKGKVVATVNANEITERDLARMMVGREVFLVLNKVKRERGRPVLRLKDVWVRGERREWALQGINLVVHEGEILGVAGVAGNGQKELAEAIVGLRPVVKGKIEFMGKDVTNAPPTKIYSLGVAYIPDSRTVGLIHDFNVLENVVLDLVSIGKFLKNNLVIKWGEVKEHTLKAIKEFEMVVDSVKSPARYLSGGNQQKLILAREFMKSPKLIIAAEPTHGLDVAATEYVRKLLLKLRDEGKAVLLISTDLDEILQLSDRIAVIYEGKIVGELSPEEATEEKLGLLMGGVSVR
ncbi:MAG TPA: ABC transporter ATP-binding protein [Acidilobales archaeon]|nr:MAG: ABC transporter ATP-binding protein [Desulfurococcales archaeon ex4484_42]HDD26430.1 ABC transporter ATP-binding protein [Acidilobales archaeon]